MKALLVVFGIAWLALLVDCLRRERFYPLLGPGIRTKVLWLVTFFLFSPIQMVLYVLFGRLLKPREQAPTWARAGVLALVIAAAGLQLMPIGSGVSGPFSLVRDAATGKLLRQGSPDPLRLDLNASVLSSESNSNSTSVVSNSDNASLMCRRLTLINLSDHPLMRRVGEEVARRLGEVPAVKRVDYYPAGSFPPPGSRGPDLLLTLDLRSVDETNLPAYRQLEANVKVAAATDLWPGRISHTIDSTTPPVIEANWTLDLQHRSRMVGYESADARYKMAAEKIGEEIGGSLGKQLAGWQEKHGLLGDLPEDFYGPYREASDVPFAGEPACTRAMSSLGLFEHNRTVWLIEDSRETAVVLRELQEKLEAAGWKSQSQSSATGSGAHVDMTTGSGAYVDLKHGARSMHIFRERGDDLVPDQTSRRIVALYREPVSDDVRCAALSEWLDQRPSPEMLLQFERMAHTCSADLQEQLGAQIEADPPATGRAYLSLARRYESRGEWDKAKSAVIRGVLLARATGEYSEIKSSLLQVAEKIGDKSLATAPASREVLLDAGFAELSPESNPVEVEVPMSEPVLAFAQTSKGEFVSICVRVEGSIKPNQAQQYQLRIILTEGDGDSSCSTAIGLSGDAERGWQADHGTGLNELRVQASVHSVGADRFRVRLSMPPDERSPVTSAAPGPD